jgi:hypothetical protein
LAKLIPKFDLLDKFIPKFLSKFWNGALAIFWSRNNLRISSGPEICEPEV